MLEQILLLDFTFGLPRFMGLNFDEIGMLLKGLISFDAMEIGRELLKKMWALVRRCRLRLHSEFTKLPRHQTRTSRQTSSSDIRHALWRATFDIEGFDMDYFEKGAKELLLVNAILSIVKIIVVNALNIMAGITALLENCGAKESMNLMTVRDFSAGTSPPASKRLT